MQPLWKTIWSLLKELKIELPYDPAIELLAWYISEKINKNFNSKRYMHPNVYSSTIYNNKDIDTTQVPIKPVTALSRCEIIYICCVHIYIYVVCVCIYIYIYEYYSAINKILLFAAMWMDLENIMLSEISQAENDKYCIISLIYGT